ncbi:MAG: hypothetical protein WBP93_20660 [Pyrinomonadaceae bacterium]
MSRPELSGGAKLAYSCLGQQANSKGAVQLYFQMVATALGRNEGQLARYLMELEESGLILVSRGNLNKEDVRVYFPHHRWMNGLSVAQNETFPSSESQAPSTSPRSFPREVKMQNLNSAQAEQPVLPYLTPDFQAEARRRSNRRRGGKPKSKHSREICHRFALFNVEVLGSKTIYDPGGFINYLYRTGAQDAEIDAWLMEESSVA